MSCFKGPSREWPCRSEESREGPLEQGDVIILTKALGTGTLLAAVYASKAKGRWVQGAIDMLQSNRRAADTAAAPCRHCTQTITGFGF